MPKAIQPLALKPDARGVRSVAFRALGTNCMIQFRLQDDKRALQFVADALDWLAAFEAKFSRFKADSLVSKINQAAGKDWVHVDAEMDKMLDLADAMHQLTGGVLDAAMLPLIQLWDWKVVHERLPSETDIMQAVSLSRWQEVKRKRGRVFLPREGMGLDFGGFGKEYAVDQLVIMAKRHGIEDGLIDLGRDLYAMGGNGVHPFWHVGIQDGVQTEKCVGGLAVSNYAVCASGDYARRFEHQGVRYGHILDLRTGWPVRHGLRAVSVIAPSCLMAGVYSTAIFVMGLVEGLRFAEKAPQLEACLQDDRGLHVTREFRKFQVQSA